MARHRHNPHLPTIPEVPWSRGIAIAALAYVALRLVLFGYSGGEPFLPMLKSLLRANSGLVLLLVGAGTFFAMLRIGLNLKHPPRVDLAAVRGLPWHEFRTLCADALQLLGYRTDLGGIRLVPNNADLVLRLGDAPVLVHCSRWRSLHVGIREVREFYDEVLHQGALRGIFVTTGTFTGPATQFAHGKPLSLIDGDRLSALLWDLRQRRGGSIASFAARQRAAALAPRQFRRKSVDGASATTTAEKAQVPASLPMGSEDKRSRSRSGELQ